jgi:hypothetical protein
MVHKLVYMVTAVRTESVGGVECEMRPYLRLCSWKDFYVVWRDLRDHIRAFQDTISEVGHLLLVGKANKSYPRDFWRLLLRTSGIFGLPAK